MGRTQVDALLGIYLNDHLAGATATVELMQRASGPHRGSPLGDALETLTAEAVADRAALLDIMRAVGAPARRYKMYTAWAAEKAGRLKLNGRLLTRSPLSTLVELEGIWLGIQGKAAGWRTLRTLAGHDSRLDASRLDELLARAERQANTVEKLRGDAVAEIF
jgi:hypothetical protein